MPKSLQETLTSEKALIFRATHRLNLPWALANGLHRRNSDLQDPNFVAIGKAYQRLPMEALMGVACYTEAVRQEVEAATSSAGVSVKVVARPDWYFR